MKQKINESIPVSVMPKEFVKTVEVVPDVIIETDIIRVTDGVVTSVPLSDCVPDFVYEDITIHNQIKTGTELKPINTQPGNGLRGSIASEQIINSAIKDVPSNVEPIVEPSPSPSKPTE